VKPRVLFLELIQNVFGKLKFSHTPISLARHPRARFATCTLHQLYSFNSLLRTSSQLLIEWKRRAQRLDFGTRV
jgi:hypothetical protein